MTALPSCLHLQTPSHLVLGIQHVNLGGIRSIHINTLKLCASGAKWTKLKLRNVSEHAWIGGLESKGVGRGQPRGAEAPHPLGSGWPVVEQLSAQELEFIALDPLQ